MLFTLRDRGTNEIHVSNSSSSTHGLSKKFPCYCFPQGAPISKFCFSLFTKWMYCLLCSSHLWKMQLNKRCSIWMLLLLAMESTMESKPKAEHCRSVWGTWDFWKIAAWLHTVGIAGTRTVSRCPDKKAVLSQGLVHLWMVSSEHSLSFLVFHLYFPTHLPLNGLHTFYHLQLLLF